MIGTLKKARLYAICDLGYLSAETAVPVSRQLLAGGAGILQLRAKGHEPDHLQDLARELQAVCRDFEVPFIVNDHLELALACGADGLHWGQEDGSLAEARDALGPQAIIGRSTHSLEQARRARQEGADYIGFGPLFPTPTKEGRPAIGLQDIATMEKEVGSQIPAFCIGGIQASNLSAVKQAGARRIVVVSHLLTSPQPEQESSNLIQQLL